MFGCTPLTYVCAVVSSELQEACERMASYNVNYQKYEQQQKDDEHNLPLEIARNATSKTKLEEESEKVDWFLIFFKQICKIRL